MCKKQTSASHRSTESEVISLDAGLHMDGIPALDLSDLVKEVLHSSHNVHTNTNTKTKRHSNRENGELSNVDYVVTSAKLSHFGAMRCIF